MTVRELSVLWVLFRLAAVVYLILGGAAGIIAALLTRSPWSAMALLPWLLAMAGEEYTRLRLRQELARQPRE